MVGSLLLRGMLVGVLAGLLAFGFARIFGEPQVDRAIALEGALGHSHDHGGHDHAAAPAAEPEEPELVSRETQAGLGLLTGAVVYGAAVGGLFALVFAFAYGRVGRLDARATAALLALGAFIALVVVPDLKYPPNPPAVGNADTIGERTGLFFIMLAISVAVLVLAVNLARGLARRHGGWTAGMIAGAVYIAIIAIAQVALPAVNEVPEGFPADLLWQFRIASLGMHAVLWTTIGLAFGALAERSFARRGGGRLAFSR
ncbi:CbtA family protein [Inquilinus limosus]|uniref:Membrane protein n=1 Tax=Inquilinus limosus MP06 TaxID=1398085 RepID=A0A0A0D0Y3_9PROT|nr:CbtA family protein [Inquilinus limosus]KGM30737.1 membrane protein [Inquilinus limosus MP06]